jgi:hypothetical protein
MKSDGEEKTKKKERMSQPKRSERMVKSEMSGERKSCDTGGYRCRFRFNPENEKSLN